MRDPVPNRRLPTDLSDKTLAVEILQFPDRSDEDIAQYSGAPVKRVAAVRKKYEK